MLWSFTHWTHRNTQLLRCTITDRFRGLNSRCLSFYLVPGKHRNAYVDFSLQCHTPDWDGTSLHEGMDMLSGLPSDTAPITEEMQTPSLDVKTISRQSSNVKEFLMPRYTCSQKKQKEEPSQKP